MCIRDSTCTVHFTRTGNTGSAGSSTPADNVFRIQDNSDNTKQIAFEAYLDGRRVRIGVMAIVSGMIHPAMATMLGYISCDVGMPIDLWKEMVTRAVECSFNSITVDGDTSTNDMVSIFATGQIANSNISNSKDKKLSEFNSSLFLSLIHI